MNVENSPANQAATARGAAQKSAAEQAAKSTGELNAVAFDPNYQNADGTKGANVVMNKEDAQAKGLQHYKADPAKLNATVAGFNDVILVRCVSAAAVAQAKVSCRQAQRIAGKNIAGP